MISTLGTKIQFLDKMWAPNVTPRLPVRPNWRIRTGFRDARPNTGTLYLIFFLKLNLYLLVWPTSYNIIKISYTFIESLLQKQNCTFTLQIRARNLHVVNPYKCVGPAVCGSLQMSSPVPTRIKTRAKLYA